MSLGRDYRHFERLGASILSALSTYVTWSGDPSPRVRTWRYFGLLMPSLGHVAVRLWVGKRERRRGERSDDAALLPAFLLMVGISAYWLYGFLLSRRSTE